MSGKLYLLPNLLEESLPIEPFFPISVKEAIQSIQGLIAESEKMARRYLRKFLSHEEMAKMPLRILNEHTQDLSELIAPLEKGEVWGLISDAGLPCIADPGADLVWLAHQKKIAVQTFIGPSSIVMALQLSGFGGQQFTFHGYLPRESLELENKIKELEKQPGTQIWIEAPYRSLKMLEALKKILQPSTKLCVAVQLTTPAERILSQTVADWRKSSFPLEKEPAVFLIA
jgi:16S rRNA (cytidine1402-2'-O)-methyltransferase